MGTSSRAAQTAGSVGGREERSGGEKVRIIFVVVFIIVREGAVQIIVEIIDWR